MEKIVLAPIFLGPDDTSHIYVLSMCQNCMHRKFGGKMLRAVSRLFPNKYLLTREHQAGSETDCVISSANIFWGVP